MQTGATLEVTTVARWVDTEAVQRVCTDDCLVMTASCATEPLAAGEHHITFASQMLTLQVPSETTTELCLEYEP